MWSKTHVVTVTQLKPQHIWEIWTDVNHWHTWDPNLEWAKLEGPFVKDAVIQLKPKTGPRVRTRIKKCIPNQYFITCTRFPLAKLSIIHHIQQKSHCIQLTTSVKISGLLGFIWRRRLGEKIATSLKPQAHVLIQLARDINNTQKK